MIKDVELLKKENGHEFVVTFEDGTVSFVPDDPENRHYREIRDWYEAQKKPPFKYKFAKLV